MDTLAIVIALISINLMLCSIVNALNRINNTLKEKR